MGAIKSAHNSCIATGNRICPPARSKPRFSSSTVDNWANNSNFRTKTINPSNDNNIYQIRASGTNVEIEVKGGGKRIFADGVDYDKNALVDAKNNASSNTLFDIDKYLQWENQNWEHPLKELEREFIRYAAVINDPNTPVGELLIRISRNNENSKALFTYLGGKYNVPTEVEFFP